MAKVSPVAHDPAAVAAMLAKIAALESENAALKSSGPAPGFRVKPIRPFKADGVTPNDCRYLAERILPGGIVVTFYVGKNGKLTIGGGFRSMGPSLWAGEDDTFDAYVVDRGPEGFKADRARVKASGKWETALTR